MFTQRYVPRTAMAEIGSIGRPLPALGLRFTELFFLATLGWACFFSISGPLFGFQLQITFLKHVPLILLLPVLALHFMGSRINGYRAPLGAILGIVWPLMLLAVFVTTGSVVARQVYEINDTFLTLGVYLLFLPIFAAIPWRPRAEHAWAIGIMTLLLLTALAATIAQLVRLPTMQMLHEIEYLVIAPFFMLWFVARSLFIRWLGLVLAVGAMVANYKLTGLILAAAGLLFIAINAGWHRVPASWRGGYLIVGSSMAVLVAGVLALLYFEFREFLPTGTPEVRLLKYELAMRQFLESPIWGSAFVDSAGEDYQEFNRIYNIPTHSDLLDMLKHGGIIGLSLFLFGYARIFMTIRRAVIATQGDRLMHGFFMTVAFFQLSALFTFAVNPLLLKPPFLIVIWGTLGMALGLALSVLRRAELARTGA